MRYTSAISRFLLELSFGIRLSIAVSSLSVAIFLFLYNATIPGMVLFLVIPITVIAWMFRLSGLLIAILTVDGVSWFYYSTRYGSWQIPLNNLPHMLIYNVILLFIGVLVSSQRDSLDIADAAQEQLYVISEEQQKLNEIKDRFLQNVNHELRTPLTAIYGYLELLLEHNEHLDMEMRATFLQHAMQSCDELQLLVNNVLDSMGIEKEKQHLYTEALAVRDVVYEVLERFDPKSVQGHSISVDIPDYIVVRANIQYVRQVLRNLLSNAFKYAPTGTPITITASLHGMVVDPLHATPEIVINVQDAGPGIPENEIPLLFGQFVRLRRDTSGHVRGSGLGLFLSKQFVEAMDGRIWVESDGIDGKGSCFRFTLPCIIRPKIKPRTRPEDFLPFSDPVPLDI